MEERPVKGNWIELSLPPGDQVTVGTARVNPSRVSFKAAALGGFYFCSVCKRVREARTCFFCGHSTTWIPGVDV